MASPSRTPKKGVKCDGKIKKGRREGQVCGKLLLAKDSLQENPSIVCSRPQCGEHHSILALLSKAIEVWGDSFRQAALAVLTKKNQEKRSQEMSDNKSQRRTIVKTVGLVETTILNEKGELLPFTKGERIYYQAGPPSSTERKVFEVTKILNQWEKDSRGGIFIIRSVYLEEV